MEQRSWKWVESILDRLLIMSKLMNQEDGVVCMQSVSWESFSVGTYEDVYMFANSSRGNKSGVQRYADYEQSNWTIR